MANFNDIIAALQNRPMTGRIEDRTRDPPHTHYPLDPPIPTVSPLLSAMNDDQGMAMMRTAIGHESLDQRQPPSFQQRFWGTAFPMKEGIQRENLLKALVDKKWQMSHPRATP